MLLAVYDYERWQGLGYVASPFLVRASCREILIQQVGRNVERMVAISRGFIFLRSDDFDAVLAHPLTGRRLGKAQSAVRGRPTRP